MEIVLDLGRPPYARYLEREVVLREAEVTNAELQLVVAGLGEFRRGQSGGDSAHGCTESRAFAIGSGGVVGLTMRVGRAVTGSVAVIEDFVKAGASILLLGRPGVGKTTILREAARVLAEQGQTGGDRGYVERDRRRRRHSPFGDRSGAADAGGASGVAAFGDGRGG